MKYFFIFILLINSPLYGQQREQEYALKGENKTTIAQNLEQIKNKKLKQKSIKKDIVALSSESSQANNFYGLGQYTDIALDTSSLSKAKDLLFNPEKAVKKLKKSAKDLAEGWEFSIVREDKNREVKRKKNVFYGIKTRNKYTKYDDRGRLIVESFYVLKKNMPPEEFSADITYFDPSVKNMKNRVKTQKILKTKNKIKLLHGIYQKYINDSLVVSGIYYKGAKHGRWEYYFLNGRLKNKEFWYKGIPKHSQIHYYDKERKKIKEIIPLQHGKKNGIYTSFYKSGNIAIKGEYIDNIKVNRWHYFFDKKTTSTRGNIKKIMQHISSINPYKEEFTPFLIREYDKNGKKIFQK